MGLCWDLIEVMDPRGVFNVDMVGEMAMGLPWAELMGPGGKAEVGVSWRQGTSQLHSSCLTGSWFEFEEGAGGNWKIRDSTAVDGGDMRPGEEMGDAPTGFIIILLEWCMGTWVPIESNEIRGSKCILCPVWDPRTPDELGSRKSPKKQKNNIRFFKIQHF